MNSVRRKVYMKCSGCNYSLFFVFFFGIMFVYRVSVGVISYSFFVVIKWYEVWFFFI